MYTSRWPLIWPVKFYCILNVLLVLMYDTFRSFESPRWLWVRFSLKKIHSICNIAKIEQKVETTFSPSSLPAEKIYNNYLTKQNWTTTVFIHREVESILKIKILHTKILKFSLHLVEIEPKTIMITVVRLYPCTTTSSTT